MSKQNTIKKCRPTVNHPELMTLLVSLILINRHLNDLLTAPKIANALGIKKQSIEKQIDKQQKALSL